MPGSWRNSRPPKPSLTAELARQLREHAPRWRWNLEMDAGGEAVCVKKVKTGNPPLPRIIGLPQPPEDRDDDCWRNWYADYERRGGMEGAIQRYCAAGKAVVVEED